MKYRSIFGWLALIAAVTAVWLSLASMALIWVLGFWNAYPWPDKLWTWARYAMEGEPNAIVHRWLTISGIVASLPVLALAGLLTKLALIRRNQKAVYGETGWATPKQMQQGGISTKGNL